MNVTKRHRQAARTLWECGGRLDETANRTRVRPNTLRQWLTDPDFRALLADEARESVLQASAAVLRWAPAAVSRLIRDLDSESASEARQAAREILKLAMEAQRDLATSATSPHADAKPPPAPGDDPLSRRVAALTDEQLIRIFGILNDSQGGDQP